MLLVVLPLMLFLMPIVLIFNKRSLKNNKKKCPNQPRWSASNAKKSCLPMPNVLLVTIAEVPPSVTSAFKSIVPIAIILHSECLVRMVFQLLVSCTWSYAVNVLM